MKNYNTLSDIVLIKKYQLGDVVALNQLVKRWHLKFCNVAFWIVNDADIAKDVAQQSWIMIIQKLETLKENEKFKSWAVRIVHRKAIDFIRVKNRESKKLSLYYIENQKNNLQTETEHNEIIHKVLLVAIQKLSVEHQMVIRLFYKENYSLKEISEILKISLGTTKSRLFHAREKLKISLKTHNYEK